MELTEEFPSGTEVNLGQTTVRERRPVQKPSQAKPKSSSELTAAESIKHHAKTGPSHHTGVHSLTRALLVISDTERKRESKRRQRPTTSISIRNVQKHLVAAVMSVSLEQMSSLYEQQGYLTSVSVLDPTELRETREAFAQLERKFGIDYTKYSLHNVHMQYDWVKGLVKHPRILEVVCAVLGPDVLLLDSRFICKYPVTKGNGGTDDIPYENGQAGEETARKEQKEKEASLPYVAWHQDMRYWGLDGGPVLSVWLALDDSLEDNGALQVIPGSHCSGMLPHRQSQRLGNMLSVNQEIPEELVQTDKAVLCPLWAGQMSIHDGLLVHASDPNTSDRRRCGFVIRYVPTCAYPIQDPDRPRHFPATVLVSGNDQYSHFSNSEEPQI